MKLNMDTLEKERDFYFIKLRDIEMLLQAKGEELSGDIGQLVLKILYASEEEKVQIDEAGNLTVTSMADGNDGIGDGNDEEMKQNE